MLCVPVTTTREEAIASLEHPCVKAYIGQEEVSDAGFRHLQVFAVTNRAITVEALKKQLCIQSIQVAQDAPQAIAYCTNAEKRLPDTDTFSRGQMPHFKGTSFYHKLHALGTKEERLAYLELPENANHNIQNGKKIRAWIHEQEPDQYEHRFKLSDFTAKPLPFNDPGFPKAVLVTGKTGIGKTAFIAAHFQNPCLVQNEQSLSRISPLHDAILFDDYVLCGLSPAKVLSYVSTEEVTTLNVKYKYATLPANVPRVFLLNHEDLFWPTPRRTGRKYNPDTRETTDIAQSTEGFDAIISAIRRRIVHIPYGDRQLFLATPPHLMPGTLYGKTIPGRFKRDAQTHIDALKPLKKPKTEPPLPHKKYTGAFDLLPDSEY